MPHPRQMTSQPEWSRHCAVCGTPLGGTAGMVFKLVGVKRSSRNPNLCNRCNTHAEEGHVVDMTVIFVDLCAFTALTARVGAQRAHEVVDAFLKMATQALVSQDAIIDKYLGDAVLAFFNVPIKRQDHPARAVKAALAIQGQMASLGARFNMELRASIGIAQGWAHVGRVGSQDRKDYTAVGEVVNLAARLREGARPGEILLLENVYASVAAECPDVPTEVLSLKGFEEPVAAYRLNPTDAAPPAPAHSASEAVRRRVSIGTVIFAVVGAPCVLYATLGPLAIPLGIGALFGASSALWWFDLDVVRIPLLGFAICGAVANLYAVWHARQLRAQAAAAGEWILLTTRERRRALWVTALSSLALGISVFELVAHYVFHGSLLGT